jgi:hypothetical protein
MLIILEILNAKNVYFLAFECQTESNIFIILINIKLSEFTASAVFSDD